MPKLVFSVFPGIFVFFVIFVVENRRRFGCACVPERLSSPAIASATERIGRRTGAAILLYTCLILWFSFKPLKTAIMEILL